MKTIMVEDDDDDDDAVGSMPSSNNLQAGNGKESHLRWRRKMKK